MGKLFEFLERGVRALERIAESEDRLREMDAELTEMRRVEHDMRRAEHEEWESERAATERAARNGAEGRLVVDFKLDEVRWEFADGSEPLVLPVRGMRVKPGPRVGGDVIVDLFAYLPPSCVLGP